MTVLEREYAALIADGHKHQSVLVKLAVRHGLSQADVLTALRRAGRVDARLSDRPLPNTN